MKEFYPWSTTTYEKAIEKYKAGRLSTLDVQISAQCNYSCRDCDSPERNIKSNLDYEHLETLIRQEPGSYDWMFICGVGEPLWGKNQEDSLRMLDLCKRMGIRCSVFTNGSDMTEQVLSYVRDGVLYPVIKMDTFCPSQAEKIYGTSEAYRTLEATKVLFEIARSSQEQHYAIAASIVPTVKNIDEIPNIVKSCVENNVFPLVAQLECAGKAKENFETSMLNDEQLLNLKDTINSIIGGEYKIPKCPSVVAGIHFSINGTVTVDKRSGLSCGWFWLEDPQMIELCQVSQISSLIEAERKIMNYRKTVIDDVAVLCNKIKEYPFGGCGGNIKGLLSDYVKIQNELQ